MATRSATKTSTSRREGREDRASAEIARDETDRGTHEGMGPRASSATRSRTRLKDIIASKKKQGGKPPARKKAEPEPAAMSSTSWTRSKRASRLKQQRNPKKESDAAADLARFPSWRRGRRALAPPVFLDADADFPWAAGALRDPRAAVPADFPLGFSATPALFRRASSKLTTLPTGAAFGGANGLPSILAFTRSANALS